MTDHNLQPILRRLAEAGRNVTLSVTYNPNEFMVWSATLNTYQTTDQTTTPTIALIFSRNSQNDLFDSLQVKLLKILQGDYDLV